MDLGRLKWGRGVDLGRLEWRGGGFGRLMGSVIASSFDG